MLPHLLRKHLSKLSLTIVTGEPHPMSIAHELSCEVAAAMLAEKEQPIGASPDALSEIVLAVHSTLRQMSNAERDRRRAHPTKITAAAHTGGANATH